MYSENDFLPVIGVLIGLVSAYYVFSDLFSSKTKGEEREPPKSQKEKRERREERQRKLKAEYEEKKAIKLKARNEKDKLYKEKKQNEENEKIEKKNIEIEKKRKAKENKKPLFSWLKPKIRTHKLSNGDKIIVDSSQVQRARQNTSIFGGSNEKSPIDEKMDNLLKELKDL